MPRKKLQKRKKFVQKKSSRHYWIHHTFHATLVIIVLFIYLVPQIIQVNTPLSELPVPALSRIVLPEPLSFETISESVLGAQTIEPTDVIKYINIEREKVGAAPLRISQKLMQGAQFRANVILKYQNFSHQDPFENTELVTVLPKVNYYYRYASENIGMGGISAQDFVGGFMHSTSHRENLLNKYLSDTGVAVVSGPYKQYYVNIAVQLFAIPGSREDELGYSKNEIEKYKTELATIDTKINPFFWTINRIIKPKDYTDEKRGKLLHQKEILQKVYSVMKENKPLGSEQVAMIMEYNNNL